LLVRGARAARRSRHSLFDDHDAPVAREILGLLNFGYSIKQQPSGVKLVYTDATKAQGATIQAYGALMKGNQQIGAESIRSVLVMDRALKNEIQGFDRSNLRHAVPPRYEFRRKTAVQLRAGVGA
jgi:hypothetical protein